MRRENAQDAFDRYDFNESVTAVSDWITEGNTMKLWFRFRFSSDPTRLCFVVRFQSDSDDVHESFMLGT